MRLALLGNHPDGLALADALVAAGHRLAVYSGPPLPGDGPRRWGPDVQPVGDLEEVLADPAVEAVIVAGPPGSRAAQLRRALQSERHVLCVHPADPSADVAYEAAMIQNDTGKVLLPLLTDALHPGVARLAELAGAPRLIEAEFRSREEVLVQAPGLQPGGFPGWDVLRALGGEVAELAGFAEGEEVAAGAPVAVAGRFERGGLFQAVYVPGEPEGRWRLAVAGERGRAELLFPLGREGPAYLTWADESGEPREEAWDGWDPWPAVVAAFEAAVAKVKEYRPAWQGEVRALELDDAARRAVERRRASVLEYPEATEEAGFKGTMTLVGCGLLWVLLAVVVVATWVPWLFWAVGPLLAVFLGLQLLRWLVPGKRPPGW